MGFGYHLALVPTRESSLPSLLAIDIGNTNTVLGLWRGDDLVAHYRIETNDRRTADIADGDVIRWVHPR